MESKKRKIEIIVGMTAFICFMFSLTMLGGISVFDITVTGGQRG